MPVRMSPADFAALGRTRARKGKASSNTPKASSSSGKRKEALPENIVESQITDWLKLMGWRVYRMSAGKRSNSAGGWVTFGEKGVADYMAWRPRPHVNHVTPGCELLFVEVKAASGRPSTKQLEWLDGARISGAEATWTDSLWRFQIWFAARFGRRAGDAPGVGLALSAEGRKA